MKGPRATGLKTFSVKQPWAGLLLAGVKPYEVRSWYPDGHKLLLVHASSGNPEGMKELRADSAFRDDLRQAGMAGERTWQRSAFVGLIEIARVIGVPGGPAADRAVIADFFGEAIDDQVLWEVGCRWSFATPISCHGQLNLWLPPAELRDVLEAQLLAAGAPVTIDGLPR